VQPHYSGCAAAAVRDVFGSIKMRRRPCIGESSKCAVFGIDGFDRELGVNRVRAACRTFKEDRVDSLQESNVRQDEYMY
jgi:hypothetical protein